MKFTIYYIKYKFIRVVFYFKIRDILEISRGKKDGPVHVIRKFSEEKKTE